MKAIEKVSNTAGFSTKKFWLPLVFGASLIYMCNPLQAGEQQGASGEPTQSKGSEGEPGKWGRAFRIEGQGSGKKDLPKVNMGNRPGGSPEGNKPGGSQESTGTTSGSEGSADKPDVNMGNRPGGDPTRREE